MKREELIVRRSGYGSIHIGRRHYRENFAYVSRVLVVGSIVPAKPKRYRVFDLGLDHPAPFLGTVPSLEAAMDLVFDEYTKGRWSNV